MTILILPRICGVPRTEDTHQHPSAALKWLVGCGYVNMRKDEQRGVAHFFHELICDIFEDTQKPLGEVLGNEGIGRGSQVALEGLQPYWRSLHFKGTSQGGEAWGHLMYLYLEGFQC